MPEFKVLGPLEVRDGSDTYTPSPPKVRSVLALLLLRAGHIVSVESLIEELWGPDPPRSAVTTVQTYIYHLRNMFAEESKTGDSGPSGREIIETRPTGYLMGIKPEQVDAVAFEKLLGEGRDHLEAGRLPEAGTVLRAALGMWEGPPLADVPQGGLLQAHAIHLDELLINALELRIRVDVRLGRHHTLIAELRSLVRAHPLNEWFHGELIAALSRCGRRGEALQAYQDVRRVLSSELGVNPSPALRDLQQQVLTVGAQPAYAEAS